MKRGQRNKYTCATCGKEIEKLVSTVKSTLVYCSKSCRAKATGKKLKNDLDYKERQRKLMLSKGNRPPIRTGADHWNWKGGISKYSRGQDYKYLTWRKEVLRKDNYICSICGGRGGKLTAHHIMPWSLFKETRYEIWNGKTMHQQCHLEMHWELNSSFGTMNKIKEARAKKRKNVKK